ncbi:MAG TPA: SurA N-terminal domain-containing protein [Xanthomonadales bacterium]|nr:SurA N-terminal domain-containing protein [Xanthomonadales bacterium]
MLQTLRDKTSGWIAFAILAAVTIPFAFFGINDYFQGGSETWVAKVGDREISQQDFRRRFEDFRQQVRAQQGDQYDPAQFDTPITRRRVLDAMVDEAMLAQVAAQAGTEPSDELLKEEISKMPVFQGADGKFDPELYKALLRQRQYTPRGFEELVRLGFTTRDLPEQVQATSLVTDADVDRYLALRDQQRTFRHVTAPPMAATEAAPTDEAVSKYYDEHKDEFMLPEQVSVEYVELDAAKMSVSVEPDEASLRSTYEDQKNRFVVAEQRLASHILVKVAPDADAAAQKAALDKATKLAADARGGKDFATLAKESSDDIGSKAAGGDLGWLEKGVTEPAFETALFALAPNTISDPVRTDEGYHVIQLREVKAEQAKPFEEVRADLAKEALDAERDRVFSDVSGRLIDAIYQDPGSLETTAKELGLEIQRTPLFGREGGPGIAANPQVVKAAFSDAVKVEGGVSDPIELGPNHVVVVHLDEHRQPKPRPLEEVRAEVVQRITGEAAAEAARARAEGFQKRLLAGESLDALATELGATVAEAKDVARTSLELNPMMLQAVFKLARPAEGKTTRSMVELPGNSFALVELSSVVDGDPKKTDAAGRESVRAQLGSAIAATERQAFLDALRKTFKIRLAEERM